MVKEYRSRIVITIVTFSMSLLDMLLPKTLDELVEYAKNHLYTDEEIEFLREGYKIAFEATKGKVRYHDTNRPFIHHLVGTAGVLMYNNANIETVVAGLLHSVKTEAVLTFHPLVSEIVTAYFDPTGGPRIHVPFDKATPIDWAVLSIQVANGTDMILAGETF